MDLDALRTDGSDRRLVLTFHGPDADAEQFHGAAEQFLPGAHVVSPRRARGEDGARRLLEGVADLDEESLAHRAEELATWIRAEIARTGAREVIAIGYRDGADLLAAVAFAHPELFHVLALMHPCVPWMPAAQPGLAMTRVLITAGRQDPSSPPDRVQALADRLAAEKADVTLAWHPGGAEIPHSEVEALSSFLT